MNEDENPVLIDPAVYYGHREMDLAMMHLFGGGMGPLIINRFDALFSNLANFIGVQCSIFLLPLVLLGFWKTRHTIISRFSVSVWLLMICPAPYVWKQIAHA